MHPLIAGPVYRAGSLLRNPSLMVEYERLKNSEWLSRAQLTEIQLERTVRLLTFAERYSPFYRKAFRECGFEPQRLSKMEDLKVLPTIDRGTLVRDGSQVQTQYEFKKSYLAVTSGTTGAALRFYKNERWDSINRAHVMRSYDWYGVKPWHRNGYLWGYDLAPDKARRTKLLDSLQNRFRMFTFDKEAVRRFALKLRTATYLRGYSSMIFEVAKIINELGLEQHPLKMVLGTSEMILDAYQPQAKEAFGRGIISEYGAAESGLIAFECPRGRLHINMEDLVIETDEDGGIIITNLASFSFPIIRYVLGDTVTLSDEYCECGREHPVMTEILGRKGVSVQSAVRRYPAFTFYYVFKNLAVHNSMPLNYKAVQEEVGIVDIYIEGGKSDDRERLIHSELSKYFDSDMTFRVHFVPFFERSRRKQQSFENRLG